MKLILAMKLDELQIRRDHLYTGHRGEGKFIPGARASLNQWNPPNQGGYGRGQDSAALVLHIHDVAMIEELWCLHHEAVMRDFPSEIRAHEQEDQRGRVHFRLTLETVDEED